jgi:transcription initiation factor TFIIB
MIAAAIYAACRLHSRPRSLKEIASASRSEKSEIAHSYRVMLNHMDIRMPIPNPRVYVSKIAAKVGVSERTQMKAIQFLNEVDKHNGFAGRTPPGLAAAALYAACQSTGEKKTQKEMAEAAEVTEITVRNQYRYLRTLRVGRES